MGGHGEDLPFKGSKIWLYFVRGTVAVAWVVGLWAGRTLLSVDKNMLLVTTSLQNLGMRVDKIELRNEERDREERERLYNRQPRLVVPGR